MTYRDAPDSAKSNAFDALEFTKMGRSEGPVSAGEVQSGAPLDPRTSLCDTGCRIQAPAVPGSAVTSSVLPSSNRNRRIPWDISLNEMRQTTNCSDWTAVAATIVAPDVMSEFACEVHELSKRVSTPTAAIKRAARSRSVVVDGELLNRSAFAPRM